MIEKLLTVSGIISGLVAILAIFLILIWTGFRMGRMTVGKPMPPVIKAKAQPMMEKDPYDEPMYGKRPASQPTVEERT